MNILHTAVATTVASSTASSSSPLSSRAESSPRSRSRRFAGSSPNRPDRKNIIHVHNTGTLHVFHSHIGSPCALRHTFTSESSVGTTMALACSRHSRSYRKTALSLPLTLFLFSNSSSSCSCLESAMVFTSSLATTASDTGYIVTSPPIVLVFCVGIIAQATG